MLRAIGSNIEMFTLPNSNMPVVYWKKGMTLRAHYFFDILLNQQRLLLRGLIDDLAIRFISSDSG